jgi:predicted phage-related endonuclease
MEAALIPVVSAAVTAVIVLVAQHFLARKAVIFDQSLRQSKEFRDQITELQTRQNYLETQLDEWKTRYYDLVNELTVVKSVRDVLVMDVKRLREEVDMLQLQVDRQTSK